ncbi:MAG: amidoligase family protein [Oscillospiraceae bacterium]
MKERCDSCGGIYPKDQLVEFDGQLLCPDCFSRATMVCSHCGERIWSDDNAGDSHTPLCQSCYDRYYLTCSRCGRIIHEDDACYADDDDDEPLCCDCFSHAGGRYMIRDYYYKPVPIFHGEGDRFFGVELEIDEGGELDSHARTISAIANSNGLEHLYCKHDGSLNDGFELVTHPMTLDYHLQEMPWDSVLRKAVELGYYSHKASTCGLHVHVNRTAFGETAAQQDACIARILYFFEKHWEELLKFSRRTQRQLERWAARYGYKERPGEILEHAKKGGCGGRYTCVNLMNADTIEFRMFRGTLKLNTLLATLQLVDRVCDVAVSLSDDELKSLSWTTFVSGCEAPELVRYLKERRLYVNEPVEAAEER